MAVVQRMLDRSTTYHALKLSRGWLRSSGWLRSMVDAQPVDRAGQPLPWITYPAIDFLTPRISPDLRVFEWGSGSSTAWWAGRTAEVIAVEHDPAWFAQVEARLPQNATIELRELGDRYVDEVTHHGLFDVIVIDGRLRVECSKVAASALTPTGVILWDNSDRERYAAGLADLQAAGFGRVEFCGLVPALRKPGVTAILSRPGNFLGL